MAPFILPLPPLTVGARLLGFGVGKPVGNLVGRCVGDFVGDFVGVIEGEWEVEGDLDMVGGDEGKALGVVDGEDMVGGEEGKALGVVDGETEGEDVVELVGGVIVACVRLWTYTSSFRLFRPSRLFHPSLHLCQVCSIRRPIGFQRRHRS